MRFYHDLTRIFLGFKASKAFLGLCRWPSRVQRAVGRGLGAGGPGGGKRASLARHRRPGWGASHRRKRCPGCGLQGVRFQGRQESAHASSLAGRPAGSGRNLGRPPSGRLARRSPSFAAGPWNSLRPRRLPGPSRNS